LKPTQVPWFTPNGSVSKSEAPSPSPWSFGQLETYHLHLDLFPVFEEYGLPSGAEARPVMR